MKTPLILAGIALLATPVFAQTTSPPPPPPETQAPADQSPAPPVADTALSDSTAPSNGPRAQQANAPTNTAAGANNSMATMDAPPPAPLASYPICKANQFDKCMEPGNGARPAKKKGAPRAVSDRRDLSLDCQSQSRSS